jgi:hypothetical protein
MKRTPIAFTKSANQLQLQFEKLERRDTPAAWGNPWPQPEQLTLSFAPDGTQVGTQVSSLTSHLRGSASSNAAWQREVLRAFQSWVNVANINLSLTSDKGLALGNDGGSQGNREQGDLRIAAAPLSSQELGVAAPFDLLDDWSGDVILNTQFRFGRAAGQYDLYTVLLQESGHALGLANSLALDSAMYEGGYLGARAGLSASDITEIRKLYGARVPDRFEKTLGNDRLDLAHPISFILDEEQTASLDPMAGASPFVAAAELTHSQDVDFYRFTLPAGQKDFWVELRTSGVSLLTSRVSVLNAQGATVASTVSINPLTGDLKVFVKNARPGTQYSVKVEGVGADFNIGAYRLAVGKEAKEVLYPPVPAFYDDDKFDDDDGVSDPVNLPLQPTQIDAAWDATHRGSISYAADADLYRIVIPTSSTAAAAVLATWNLDDLKLDPQVSVVTDTPERTPIPVDVLQSETGKHVVQLRNPVPGQTYLVQVQAHNSQGSFKEGNYLLGIDLRQASVPVTQFAAGTLMPAVPQQATVIENPRTTLLQLVLAVEGVPTSDDRGVVMTIFDDRQQVVFSLATRPGEANSATLLLAAGTYTVQFLGVSRDSESLVDDYNFTLTGLIRNDPIGPQPIGVVTQPIGSSTGTLPASPALAIRPTPLQQWLRPIKPSALLFRAY